MKQRFWIRAFLVGVPLGLIVLGIAAVILYYNPLKVESRRGARSRLPLEARQKAASAEDLRRHAAVLREKIGPRPPEDTRSLEVAAKWLESTLGPTNAGFAVRSETHLSGGQRLRNLSVEMEGGARASEVVVVAVRYAATPGAAASNAADVAAALGLAQSLVGAEFRRTVRIAFWPAVASDPSPATTLLAAAAARHESVVAVLELRGMAAPEGASDVRLRLAGRPQDEQWLRQTAHLFQLALSSPVEIRLLEDHRAESLPRAQSPVAVLSASPDAVAGTPVDFEALARFTRGLESVLRHLADSRD